MKTKCFDAVLSFSSPEVSPPKEGVLYFPSRKSRVSFRFLDKAQEAKPGHRFVEVSLRQPLLLRWQDYFKIKGKGEGQTLGEGKVLRPYAAEEKKAKADKRLALLFSLNRTEKDMLLALCREKGSRGLNEKEIAEFSGLAAAPLLRLGQKLEEEGQVKILSFSPFFLISGESFELLGEKILMFLAQFHEKHPGEKGVSLERLKKRFVLPQRILALALKFLAKAGKVRHFGNVFALPSHERKLTGKEEDILSQLEEICFKGEFRTVSFEEIKKRFHLSPASLEKMLSILIERRKIFEGEEGFFLHAHWLEEVVQKIRNLGKRDLTVGEFKAMTGLSRKYAIPLLELLDRMGVTRRKGPLREIL